MPSKELSVTATLTVEETTNECFEILSKSWHNCRQTQTVRDCGSFDFYTSARSTLMLMAWHARCHCWDCDTYRCYKLSFCTLAYTYTFSTHSSVVSDLSFASTTGMSNSFRTALHSMTTASKLIVMAGHLHVLTVSRRTTVSVTVVGKILRKLTLL